MKLFVVCSKAFYDKIPLIQSELEGMGCEIVFPNCYGSDDLEGKLLSVTERKKWKSDLIRHSEKVISEVDSLLVLNYTKNGVENYIGGATFLEMYNAFRLGKTIYLMNDIPDNLLKDEISAFCPIIINGDLSKINVEKDLKLNIKCDNI